MHFVSRKILKQCISVWKKFFSLKISGIVDKTFLWFWCNYLQNFIADYRHWDRCIGTPASRISVRTRSLPVSDWGPLFRAQRWFRHRLFCSFRNLPCTSKLQVMKRDTPARPYTAAGDVVFYIRCWKIIAKCRMLGGKLVRHRHFTVSQLPPSGIAIPA